MNRNQWIFVLLGVASLQLAGLDADERMNLYDRNQRQLEWERSQDDYFQPYNPDYNQGYYNQSYYQNNNYNNNYYQQRGYRGAMEEPTMAPPE